MDTVQVTPVDLRELNQKYLDVGKYFESCYGIFPSFFVRVPGRVNLIGEHIDYCGFSVLPMAIEQDIILAVRANENSTLNLRNFEDSKYQNFTAPVQNLFIDKSKPQWHHYFVCGYKGIYEKFTLETSGLDVVVKGTVPPSSGLSSSSALVCASALATCFANRILLNKYEMASLCAVSERLIGTEGGGMDQAIGFLAEPGTAKLIDFNPLKASSVPLPDDAVFVISNSCVAMNKAASSQFNIRVIECRLAAKVIAKKHGLDWRKVEKLSEIPILLNYELSEMKSVICNSLKPGLYERSELCSLFEILDNEFANMLSENTKFLEKFQLFKRATHVFEEAFRVLKFKQVCEENRKDLLDLGQLMNDSHASCRDLYECSHPQLDALVNSALDAGAVGSRLTGAGWGGCCVSLVEKSKVTEYLQTLSENFYSKIEAKVDVSAALFSTKPSGGAAVFVVNN